MRAGQSQRLKTVGTLEEAPPREIPTDTRGACR
jgi:hypothetical protein